jgi:hypothetical protein
VLPGFARAEIAAEDGTLLRIAYAEGRPGAPSVLFFMGNAGALSIFEPWLAAHRAAGRGVAALEYRGGGGNPGRASEARLKADAVAAFDWLRARGGGPIYVHGFSLGAGLAIHVAARREAAGAILEAPFAQACRLMARASLLPACRLPVQRWDSLADVPGIEEPVLLLHGDADRQIPIGESELLFAAFASEGRAARLIRFGGYGHSNLTASPDYAKAIAEFLAAP